MSEKPINSYDEIPYDSRPFRPTRPSHLATMGKLFGMDPPRPERCRVLELGCASGFNLFAMAQAFAESEFVGVDASAIQIRQGRDALDEIGITNVRLEHRDILDVGPDFGQFDYIVCHGVYSWVPEKVRRQILTICKQNLSPQGVAYVSYNTFPGWHMRATVREMMLYHCAGFSEPQERIDQSRALLAFLAESVQSNDSAYSKLLSEEVEIITGRDDSYLYHEHLEAENQPVYFHHFIGDAAEAGLQFLSEVHLATSLRDRFPQPVAETLGRIAPNLLRLEQYMDFLRNRKFRQTLLCHAEAELRREIAFADLQGLYAAAMLAPAGEIADVSKPGPLQFAHPEMPGVTLSSRIQKAAALELGVAWPRSLVVEELARRARERIGPPLEGEAETERDLEGVSRMVLNGHAAYLIELCCVSDRFVIELSDKPVASPLARYQARKHRTVTNLRHEEVPLADLDRQVVQLLDGTRDRATLLLDLEKVVAAGEMEIKREEEVVTDPDLVRKGIEAGLADVMPALIHRALFLK